jgi:hypothetical protein
MGWGLRLLAAFVMLASLTTGLWLLSLACLLYLAYSLRPRRRRADGPRGGGVGVSPRYFLAALLFVLSAAAASAGGRLSPFAFLGAGLLVVLYPKASLPTSEVVPLPGSVLLRSKYLPFRWHVAARVEPTQEELPRALAAFQGTLVIDMASGKLFTVASCTSLSRRAAESRLLQCLRDSASKLGTKAYLLPLDPNEGGGPFEGGLKPARLPRGDLAEGAHLAEGVLALLVAGGTVLSASAYKASGTSGRRNPLPKTRLEAPPLLWEVLDDIGRAVRWADPDPHASLVESLSATRREPLGESVDSIQGNEQTLTVRTLGGESHEISRAKFRAAVAIYR